jgi:hypothetical protein
MELLNFFQSDSAKSLNNMTITFTCMFVLMFFIMGTTAVLIVRFYFHCNLRQAGTLRRDTQNPTVTEEGLGNAQHTEENEGTVVLQCNFFVPSKKHLASNKLKKVHLFA